MGHAVAVSIVMADMVCGKCGIHFSVPEDWRAEKKATGDGWYCPNGHGRVYGESDVDAARKALDEEKRRHKETLARLNEAEAAEKKAATALKSAKRRINAGVCPCCNRTFQALGRHMRNSHPEYTKDEKQHPPEGLKPV